MHDINGKTLHVGDEVTSHAFGLCKILGVEDEDNWQKEGANLRLKPTDTAEFCARVHIAQLVKVRTWKELAAEALAVQDACNLSGVVISFGHIIREVRTRLEGEGKGGTDAVNAHPVCQLFADKVAHLTNTQTFGNDEVSKAYKWAYDVKGGV